MKGVVKAIVAHVMGNGPNEQGEDIEVIKVRVCVAGGDEQVTDMHDVKPVKVIVVRGFSAITCYDFLGELQEGLNVDRKASEQPPVLKNVNEKHLKLLNRLGEDVKVPVLKLRQA